MPFSSHQKLSLNFSLALISDLPLSLLISPHLQVRTDLNGLIDFTTFGSHREEIIQISRSSPPVEFLEKGVLKICRKFTGEHLCGSVISTMLQSNFTEIALRHECSSVNMLHIFRTSFCRNTFKGLLLYLKQNFFSLLNH